VSIIDFTFNKVILPADGTCIV